jgi:hypothetical protein
MSPSRRSRRGLAPFVPALVVSGLVVFLLIGGVLYIGQGSGPFHGSVDQSFAAQADELAVQSNASGGLLRQLMSSMPSLRRSELQATLDDLVSVAQRTAEDGVALASLGPGGTASTSFETALDDRAQAATSLRGAVDGLLGLAPLPTIGAASASGLSSAATGSVPPAMSPTTATARVSAVGALLEKSDREWLLARTALLADPGAARLVRSSWVTNAGVFGVGAVETLVDELNGSPTLAPVVDVRLVAVRLTPPVVPPSPPIPGEAPPPSTTAGVSIVSPTHRLIVTPALDNAGNVAEARLGLTVTLQELPKGRTKTLHRTLSLGPGDSVAVSLPALAVTPGATYGLTVTVNPPAGQNDLSAVSVPATLEIAPQVAPPRS